MSAGAGAGGMGHGPLLVGEQSPLGLSHSSPQLSKPSRPSAHTPPHQCRWMTSGWDDRRGSGGDGDWPVMCSGPLLRCLITRKMESTPRSPGSRRPGRLLVFGVLP